MEAREDYRAELARQVGKRVAKNLAALQQRARTRWFLQHPYTIKLQIAMWAVLGAIPSSTH